jgi:hypothetical protein
MRQMNEPRAASERRWYKRPFIIVMMALLVIAASVGAAIALTSDDTSGPSSSERASCAALQDLVDDMGARSGIQTLASDLRRAGEAANRGSNSNLSARIAAARQALGEYIAGRVTSANAWEPAANAIAKVGDECKKARVTIQVPAETSTTAGSPFRRF